MTGFLVAGTASGVGKTTVTLALIAAFRRRGRVVQAYKGGPDFLDTGHHTRISERPARNLDTWILSPHSNIEILSQASDGADSIIAEGMMGLFDGKSGSGQTGSSAEIAKLLKLPVVLVLDASKSAGSIAAVVLGFEMFDPQLIIAGVVLNRCASKRHFQMLEAAILAACKTPVLGWLPRETSISIPERHLGLQTVEESSGSDATKEALISTFAFLAEKYVNLDYLLGLQCGLDLTSFSISIPSTTLPQVRIGVARDKAFSFYYEDNLELLREQGAVIVPFSPLSDSVLPANLDALYLGGGYPELYSEQLARNSSFLADIRAFADSGRPVYAECGGMIYLSQRLTTLDETTYNMAGVLPLTMEMTKKLVHFGYATLKLKQTCLLGTQGTTIRGHSFHYSCITNKPEITSNYSVQYSLSGEEESEGFSVGNVLASYIHLHFRSNPDIASSFIEHARSSIGVSLVVA